MTALRLLYKLGNVLVGCQMGLSPSRYVSCRSERYDFRVHCHA